MLFDSEKECENIIKLRNSDLWRREINDDEFLALRFKLINFNIYSFPIIFKMILFTINLYKYYNLFLL